MPVTLPSYAQRKEARPQSVGQVRLPSYAQLDIPPAQSLPIIEYQTITNEPEEVVSNWERFGRRFLEGFVPLGYNADLPKPETTWQTITEVIGGLAGFGAGFALISAFTGGAGSLAHVSKAGKLYRAAKGATKVVKASDNASDLIKAGKAAKVATKASKLMRTGKGAEGYAMAKELVNANKMAEATHAFGMMGKGQLGKSARYMEAITKLTAVDPRLAQMANTGFTNLLVFNAQGQAYLPPGASVADRLTALKSSTVQSVLFSAASSLRVLGKLPKFMKQPYKATGMHLSEAGMLFGIGAGSDILTEKLGITAQSDMSKTDRIIHGLGLVAFHYARLGMNKVGVESKMRTALRSAGYKSEVEINRIVKAGRKVWKKAIEKATGKDIKKLRPESKRQIYEGKKTTEEVDLLKVYSRADGKGVVVYHDTATGEVKRIFGSSPKDALSKFKGRFKFTGKEQKETPIEPVEVKEADIVTEKRVRPSRLKYIPDKEKEPTTWKSWNRLRGSVKGLQKDLGIPNKEFREIMSEVMPESKGHTTKMTGEQLARAKYMLTPEKPSLALDVVNRAPLSSFEQIPIKARKALDTFFVRGAFPVSTALRMTKNKWAIKLADMMEGFELHRQWIAGQGIVLNSRMKKELGVSLKDINIGEVNPKKFGDFIEGKGNPKAVKEIKQFYDIIWTRMAIDGVEVKSIVNKNYEHVPLFRVYTKDGRIIPNEHIDPTALTPAGKAFPSTSSERNNAFVRILKGKQKIVRVRVAGKPLNKGKIVEVGKVEGRYEPEYVTLQLTKAARKQLGVDEFTKRAVNHIANNDPEIKMLVKAGKITPEEAVILAGNIYKEYSAWVGQKGVFGQQYSRVAELPPQFAWNSKGEPIELAKFNVKKGDKVKDINGKSHVVDKVIDIYERRLDKVIGAYTQQAAHIASTYRFYGRGGSVGDAATKTVNKIKTEHSERFGKWAEKMVDLQANMTEAGPFAKGFGHVARVTANIGLSSPMSGFKNLVLGHTQLYSTFGLSNMLRAWGSFLSKDMGYKAWMDITKAIGGTEIGVHEIITAPYAKYSPGLMRPTEIYNRIASVATGDFGANTALAVLTGYKTPVTAFMSKTQARHFLKTTLKLKNVDGIIARETAKLKASRKKIKEAPGFKPFESRKIRQMSHLVTQGGPTIPFVPGWAGSPMAKPLTLFYRIAYRVTENVVNNVMKPMVLHGNPLPMMRYVAAHGAAGASLYWLYYRLLGKEKNRFKSVSANYWMNFIRGEGLAVMSNAFDEYGGVVETYTPVILRTLQDTYNQTLYVASGSKRPYNAIKDWSVGNVVFMNHAQRAWQKWSKKPLGEVRHVRQLRRQFEEKIFGKWQKYGDLPAPTKKTPYYRAIRDSFWGEDEEGKANAHFAAIYYLANELEKERWLPSEARDEALRRIRGVVSNLSPVPQSWYKKGGRYESRYLTFKKSLSAEDYARVQKIMQEFKRKKSAYTQAVNKYYNQFHFKAQ